MLNGISPLLIYTFPVLSPGPTFNAIQGIPLVGDFLVQNIGVPIPLYLDQNRTGLYVESETKAIDIDTEARQNYDTGIPQVSQRGTNSLITINMLAQKDNIQLAVVLALNDIIFSKLASKQYSISYLNGPTTVFNGLFHGFSTSVGTDDDLVRLTMQISKANQKGPVEKQPLFVLPKITGATPVAGTT